MNKHPHPFLWNSFLSLFSFYVPNMKEMTATIGLIHSGDCQDTRVEVLVAENSGTIDYLESQTCKVRLVHGMIHL